MEDRLESFVSQFQDFETWPGRQRADYFAFFLLAVEKQTSVTASEINQCFIDLSLHPYKRLTTYLSDESGEKGGRYIKNKGKGYILERSVLQHIGNTIKGGPQKKSTSRELAELANQITEPSELAFLDEALNCYQIEANRAAVILVWILAIDHLQRYVFNDKKRLTAFNVALSKNPPSKKISLVKNYDDFSDIREGKIIELLRSSRIISNDVKKILDAKLGTRNTAAHPSTIKFSAPKANEFITDLIQNVILKYK